MFKTAGQVTSDTAELRKSRGAYFTPEPITRFITNWAIRASSDAVLEPSAGDAAFMVAAVRRLRELGTSKPTVDGVEIHAESAKVAHRRVEDVGGSSNITIGDFFTVESESQYSVVVGNPPYVRYQDFAEESRRLSQIAALKSGVALTAMASSWAAFTIHSASFLKPGGRMGLVLPAELLSVNYAAAVRRFLFDRFRSVELVLFNKQVFPEAETDVLLLLADGFEMGPTGQAMIYKATDAESLATLSGPHVWKPVDPAAKWTSLLVAPDAEAPLENLRTTGHFGSLEVWGDTTLGMVTGKNRFFALSPKHVEELELSPEEVLPLSPPGSAHLRGLELSRNELSRLGKQGKAIWLFRPPKAPSPAAQAYIDAGRDAGVDEAYKCRVRKPWYRVGLLAPADLLLTYMNADTPRLTTNNADAHHLNSVHGVYLKDEFRKIGRELLPLASLNSITLLNAEMVGRAYGGGVLKLEPREADVWAMPSPQYLRLHADQLREIKKEVGELLRHRKLSSAVEIVNRVLLIDPGLCTEAEVGRIRDTQKQMLERRTGRGRSGR